ncbi:potassium-transporting ATPase subunit F [Nocardia vinacea]|uniref:Potassium-transporting ATPase subunit F n=1 Tax=Nocardia vinacea TaxID=96468 RepID=A0ABZ1Z200_9NOCA|nr:potassium-transporting ATPase subunit F [Nocardia vinacea]
MGRQELVNKLRTSSNDRLTRHVARRTWSANGGWVNVCRGVHGAHRGDLRATGPDPAWGGKAVIANLIGLVLAVLIAVYLVAALLFPERF